MGDRYYIDIVCECGRLERDWYYAPTSELGLEFRCPECDSTTDLESYTGISFEDASNLNEIREIIEETKEEYRDPS